MQGAEAEGKLFLLPAYFLADLRDEHDFDFVSDVVRSITDKRHTTVPAWIGGLIKRQRSALCDVFELLKCHPEFYSRQDELAAVIECIGDPTRGSNAG